MSGGPGYTRPELAEGVTTRGGVDVDNIKGQVVIMGQDLGG